MIYSLAPIALIYLIIILLMVLWGVIFRYPKRNKLQNTLLVIIVLWILMYIGLGVNMLSVYDGMHPPSIGVLNFHHICMGLIGLFSLLSYPVAVLHSNILNVRRTLLLLSPVLVTIAVYIVWHLVVGQPLNYRYLTFDQLWISRFSVPVILRVLMLFFFVIYLVVMLSHIWLLIPVYKRYSEDHFSDTAHNVEWLRLVAGAISSICTAYLAVLFFGTLIIEFLYVSITAAGFIMLTVNAISHKIFSARDQVDIRWDFSTGWVLSDKKLSAKQVDYDSLRIDLEQWFSNEQPFVNTDFKASDVYVVFPQMRGGVLRELLVRQNTTFQSYVRQWRVALASEIIEANPDLLCKEVAFQVGFSSSQAFSRAFVAVKQTAPIDVKKRALQHSDLDKKDIKNDR